MRWQPKPELVTIRVDTREQRPYSAAELGMRVAVASLKTGDYAIHAAPSTARVERKSLVDFVQCCGRERERFQREVQRLITFPRRLLLIESDLATIDRGAWPGKVKPATVVGSLLSWQAQGLPVLLAGSRQRAAKLCGQFLYQAAREIWRDARELVQDAEAEAVLA